MYTAEYNGIECKVFYNRIHIETWNKEVSLKAHEIFLEHYLDSCKCLQCVVGGAVGIFINRAEEFTKEWLTRPECITR